MGLPLPFKITFIITLLAAGKKRVILLVLYLMCMLTANLRKVNYQYLGSSCTRLWYVFPFVQVMISPFSVALFPQQNLSFPYIGIKYHFLKLHIDIFLFDIKMRNSPSLCVLFVLCLYSYWLFNNYQAYLKKQLDCPGI